LSVKKASVELEQWHEVKRLHGLTDTEVQMARELGMKPKRLLQTDSPGQEQLAIRIANLYLMRFRKPLPDTVTPLRQTLHEARARERAEVRERQRRKRQADLDHAEAARASLLTLHRLLNAERLRYAVGAYDDLTEPG
jgi:CHAD domain-containing protein